MSELDAALERLRASCAAMPPVAALQFVVEGFDGDALVLSAPLDANVNDKGTAFGGSLVALMTLAGWSLVTLRLDMLGIEAEVYVADSNVKYLAPLREALRASARLGEGEDWEAFLRTLRERGKARLNLQAQVDLPGGGVATAMQARFVAFAKG